MTDERSRVVTQLRIALNAIRRIQRSLADHDSDDLFTEGPEAEQTLEAFSDWAQMEIDNAAHEDDEDDDEEDV